jgi:hypothetical protein
MSIRYLTVLPALLLSAGISTSNAAEHQPRFGAVSSSRTCSVSLSDGRSFLSGGSISDNSIATAGFFHKDGQIVPSTPMLAPRASHICIALQDGSILVAGGVTGPGGPTNAAELFNPTTNLWTTTGSMLTARTDAAAILLSNGNVLVAGGRTSGQIANSLEIYDPAAGRFRLADGVLSSPRSRHAIAILKDGRVLIGGGFDGERTLDSMDIFDPVSATVRPAGFMSGPREAFTATELSDGRILLAGGFDGSKELASAELFDPATGATVPAGSLAKPHRTHIAIRAAGSENILIAGGRSGLAAELFVPSLNAFVPAVESSQASPGVATITVAALDSTGKPTEVKTWSTAAAPQ